MKETIPKFKFSTKSTEIFPLTIGQIETLETHKNNMALMAVENSDSVFLDEAIEVNKIINQYKNK